MPSWHSRSMDVGRCTESQSFSLWTAVPFPLPFTVHLFSSWPQTDLESTETSAGCCFFPMAPAQQWLFLPQKHKVGFMFSYNPRLAILHNHLSLQDKAISKTFINCNEKIAPKEKLRRRAEKAWFEVGSGKPSRMPVAWNTHTVICPFHNTNKEPQP